MRIIAHIDLDAFLHLWRSGITRSFVGFLIVVGADPEVRKLARLIGLCVEKLG